MSVQDYPFDWQRGIHESRVTTQAFDYLNMLQDLFKDDREFWSLTVPYHTCACDDAFVLLDHARRIKLMNSVEDFRDWDATYQCVKAGHVLFYSDAEVDRRLQQADGNCPLCGFRCEVERGGDSRRAVVRRCHHFISTHTTGDVEKQLKLPRVWSGRHWPYERYSGRKLTGDHPAARFADDATECAGCMAMHQYVAMEDALFQLAHDGYEPEKSHEFGCPVAGLLCPRGACNFSCGSQGKLKCDGSYLAVKRLMQEADDGYSGSKEVCLNGAGLKLLLEAPRTPMMGPAAVSSFMCIAGDQVDKYPGFAEHAHKLFESMGIPTTRK
jgi:hypothetical protein